MDQNNLNENNVSSGYDRGNYLGSVKRQFGWIGLSYTVFFLVYNLTMGIMSYLYQTIFPGGVDGLLSLPSSFKNLVYYAMMFIPAYLIGVSLLYAMLNRIKSNVPGRATMTGSAWAYTLFIIVFLVYIGNLIGVVLMNFVAGLNGTSPVSSLDTMMGETGIFTQIIFVVILAPIVEELCFRKFLIDKIGVYGERNAMILSGLIFALFHGNIYQFFYAFFLGVIFSYIYIRSGKIKYTIALHCIVNFFGGALPSLLMKTVDLVKVSELEEELKKATEMGNSKKIMELVAQIYTPQFMLLAFYLFFMFIAFLVGLILFIRLISNKKIYLDGNGTPMTRSEVKKVTYGNVGMIVFIVLGIAVTILSMVSQTVMATA